MNSNKKEIFDELKKMALVLDGNVTQEKLNLMTEILGESFSAAQINFAARHIIRTQKWFPAISDFFQFLEPQKNQESFSEQVTGKIIQAISEIGPYRSVDARAFIGEDGWRAVERFGGWAQICLVENDQVTSTRAQLRNLIRSIVPANPESKIEKVDHNSPIRID